MNKNILNKIPWQFKLLVLILVLGIGPSIVISFKVVQFVKDEFKSSINSQLIFSTKAIVSNIDATFQRNKETSEILRQSIENPEISPEQKVNFISAFVRESNNILSAKLFFYDNNKFVDIISSTKDSIKESNINLFDLIQNKSIQDDIHQNKILITSPKFDRNISIWYNWIILPVVLPNKLKAFLAVQINLTPIANDIENHLLSKIGKLFILDERKEIFLTKEFTNNVPTIILEDAVSQLQKENRVSLINNYKLQDSKSIVSSFGYPKEVNWVVVCNIEEDAAYATVNDFIIFISLFISIATLLAIIISLIFSKFVISKPIENLATASQKIARGSFDVPINYLAKDSIGVLNSSLNQMGLQLQKNFQEIEKQKKELEDYSKNLEIKVQERTFELHEANQELKKAYQRVLELNEEKNEFLGIAAHDLKNPLTAVSAFADILINDKDLSKEQHDDFLNEIIKASERMFFIVKNLLDVNAIEQGKLNTKLEKISLISVVEELHSQFKDALQKKNITLNIKNEIEESFVLADYNLSLQVVQNILSNAIKFSQKDKNIFVTLRNSKDNEYIELSIKDEGPGFTEEDKKKLFKKFVKLSARPTAGEHSTGLGLSIVKKLIEMMNGKIELVSEAGKGAEFIISFVKAS